MKNKKPDKASKKTARLEAIHIADERTERTKNDLYRNVGAETEGGAGSAGTPSGDGNSVRSGDADLPLDTGFGTS